MNYRRTKLEIPLLTMPRAFAGCALMMTLALTGCSLIPLADDTTDTDHTGTSIFEYQSSDESSTPSVEDTSGEEGTTDPVPEGQTEETGWTLDSVDLEAGSGTSLPMGLLKSAEDLNLTAQDDKGKNYTFTYNGQEYTAVHTADHWKIKNSYDINDEADMMIICQALIDLHPIHGKDMVSYRTAEDMVYEWAIHNLGYALVSDDDSMKSHLRDIDFDPQDQGCDFKQIYYNHTGKEFDMGSMFGG